MADGMSQAEEHSLRDFAGTVIAVDSSLSEPDLQAVLR
jgi:hypothetical protein